MARSSSEEWAKRVARWKDSGLTAKEFAAETGVNPSTLAYWRWRLSVAQRTGSPSGNQAARAVSSAACRRKSRAARARKPATTAAPEFVEIPVATLATTAPATLELLLGEDVRVRIPAGFDEATLKRVVRALGAAR